ncbi:MAG: hypothetical protein ACRYFZ_16100 [Janthinobacterium lividum]
MFTPLFFRRLIFIIEWLLFGAAFAVDGMTRLGLILFSVACGFAGSFVATKYGEAAQPLFPQVQLPQLPQLPKGSRALLLGAAGLGVFLLLPWAVRLVYPAFNAFGPDTINAYTLGACQFFTALTMAYAAWRLLFPSLYAYAAETMEGKILESITSDLLKYMPQQHSYQYAEGLIALAERRKIATLTFIVRCTRFAFSVSPFVLFFVQANHALASALTVVPPSAPGL